MRTESTPLGKFDEAFNAMFWQGAPYRWPVVGWASDLPVDHQGGGGRVLLGLLRPQQPDGRAGRRLRPRGGPGALERYFGRIPRGTTDPPEVVTDEPKQIGEKRYNAEAETPPTVRVWWHAVPFIHRDRTSPTCCPTS